MRSHKGPHKTEKILYDKEDYHSDKVAACRMGEDFSTNSTSNRGVISKIYKELRTQEVRVQQPK